MICAINYIYDKNKDGEKVLLGAKVIFFDGEKFLTKEIYVGFEFCLEDILENDINANLLHVLDKRQSFERIYKSVSASGIIYFPQSDKYHFLEEGDMVLTWNGNEKVAEMIENQIAQYQTSNDEEIRNKMQEKLEYLKTLDPFNPLVELFDCKMVRARKSER